MEFLYVLTRMDPDDALAKRFHAAQSDDELIAVCIDAAAVKGCDVTAADIRDALVEMDAERREKTQDSVQDLQKLEDDEVGTVAGGVWYSVGHFNGKTEKVHACYNDFKDNDCNYSDACHHFYVVYKDCNKTYWAENCTKGDYIESGKNKGCYATW